MLIARATLAIGFLVGTILDHTSGLAFLYGLQVIGHVIHIIIRLRRKRNV